MTEPQRSAAAEAMESGADPILSAVLEEMRRVAQDQEIELGAEFSGSTPSMDVPLLESGLDSIGFATVVALLEERLGYDPFLMSDEPIYPTTLAEFVAVYRDAAPEA